MIQGLMFKAFCPTCKFIIYSSKRVPGERYEFNCTCGCKFRLESKFAKKV